jgi:hypothetical protein
MTPTEIEAGDERRVLEALAHKRLGPHWGWPDRFNTLLDAGAYLDAAMMLVPEGWVLNGLSKTPEQVKLEHTGDEPLPDWSATLLREDCAGYANRSRFKEAYAYGEAATPALALCVAIARATPPTA